VRSLLVYLAAAAAYLGAGMVEPYLLFTWFGALGFLLVVVWILPALARRLPR